MGDGYCKITPKGYSSYALSIASGSETTENGTVRIETYSSGNTRQQWFIYKVPGGYVLKARSCGISNLVLSVSEGNLGNGAVVSQRAYVNNLSYKEEWFIGEPPLDGVYYIINGTMYCEAAYPKAKDHENVDLYELFPPNGDVAFRAAQMWRIKHLGGGRYSVRPLHKLNMGLNAYGSDVDIIDVSASDTTYAIDDSAEWCIEPFGDKYVFMNYGDTGKALTATGITNTSNVTVSSYAVGNFFQLWTLTKVPEASIPKDILFYSASSGYIVTNQTRYIAPKETLTLSDMDILIGAIDAYNISQYGTWSVASAETQYMTVNSASGAATGKQHKTAGITVTCSRFISGTMCSKSYTMNVTAIPNGTYFLKNKQNSNYAKVKNDSLANNQNAVQYDFDGSNYERWTFRLNGLTGYYSIKSAASGSISYYLAVKDDSAALDHQIVVRSATEASLTNGMRWRVQTTASGAYKIIPKTGEANDYVLATSTSLGTNNADLVQGDYILNNSYRDEWYFIGNCDVRCVGIQDASHESCDHTSTFPNIIDAMLARGFTSYQTYEYLKADSLAAFMASSKIIVTNSHGTKTKIELNDSDFSITTVNSLQDGSLSDLKLVLFVACETGKGGVGANNLVNAVAGKCAQIVMGFEEEIYCHESDMWVNTFFQSLGNGNTISSAIGMANMYVYLNWHGSDITTDSLYCVGNTDQSIFDS